MINSTPTISANPVIFDTNGKNTIIDLIGADIKKLRLTDAILVNPTIDGGEFQMERIKIKEAYWSEESDAAGFNQLSNPRTLPQFDVANFKQQGVSVSIALETAVNPFIVAGGPYEESFSSYEGGVGIYEKPSPLVDYSLEGAYEYASFTSDAYAGVFSDISEDGLMCAMTVGNGYFDPGAFRDVPINVMEWNGTDFNFVNSIADGGFSVKISGRKILTGRINGSVALFERVTPPTWTETFLFEPTYSGTLVRNIFIERSGTLVYYYKDNAVKKWIYSGSTWSTTTLITDSSLVAINMYVDNVTELIVYSSPTTVYCYRNGLLVQTFDYSGVTAIALSQGYLFMYKDNTIYIATYDGTTWTPSLNTTSSSIFTTGVTTMACNLNTLVLGRPDINVNGAVTIYDINPYVNYEVKTNQIVFNETDLLINSNYGSLIMTASEDLLINSSNFKVTGSLLEVDLPQSTFNGSLTASTLATTSIGSTALPALRLGANSGLNWNSQLSLINNGAAVINFSGNVSNFTGTLRATSGSGGNAAYGFTSSGNSGMYYEASSFDSLPSVEFTVSGSPKFRLGINRSKIDVPMVGYEGTAASPGFGFSAYAGTGMHASPVFGKNRVGLSVDGADNFSCCSALLGTNHANIYMGIQPITLGGQPVSVAIGTRENNRVNLCIIRNPSINAGTSAPVVQFIGNAGAILGSIACNGSSTFYNTTSDYRLKENVVPISNALDTIELLKPCTFTWKSNGLSSHGFIAHELQEVFPDAVSGEKDAMSEFSEELINPQSIDPGKLVSLLAAGIKDLINMNKNLEARISALETLLDQ